MYSKVYWITCDEGRADELLSHYDRVVAPAIRESDYHVGHHMVQAGSDKWLLVSNYTSGDASVRAGDMVQRLVADMSEQFGMKLDVITEGEVIRDIS